MAQPVTKIYELRTLGFADIHKDLQQITKDFEAIKKAKRESEQALSKASATGNTDDAKKYREELHKIKIEEAELKKGRQQMINDAKAETLARKSSIEQQKEANREAKEQANNVKAAAGSYAELYKQQKQLYALLKPANKDSIIDFGGQKLNFEQAIAEYKRLASAEQAFRRQFQQDGTLVGEYTTGIVQAFKKMGLDDLISGQVTKANDRLKSLNSEFNNLQRELSETRVSGQGSLEAIERQLIDNRNEAIALSQQVGHLQTELRGTGDIGSQITASLSNGFKQAKGQVAQLLLGYVGFQAILNGVQSGVGNAAIISDQTTDLELQFGGAGNAADKLNDSLKKLDTRTTVQGLQSIADTALKAGVTKDNIEGVTVAIDKTKIAFGKDFGSVEEGTETFAKLINIFFEDRQITGDRILGIGNSIRTLANETVASVPYITDFSGRMAGLRQIANITLPDVLGLGAGFEEFKQSAETSSTALVTVIPKLANDVDKFSKIAGLTIEEFKKVLNENPAEALLKVSEGLVKGRGDIEGVAAAFADAGLDAGRVTTILGTLGGKADVFRERIKLAGSAMSDNSAITDAFEKKNNNLAATIDKISKKFSDVAANKAFQLSLVAITGIVTFLLTNLPGVITLLALYGIGWLTVAKEIEVAGVATSVTNGQLLLQRAALLGNNIILGITRLYIIAAAVAQSSYNAVLALYSGVMNRAAAATILFGNATRLIGLGAILTILALIIAGFKAFGAEVTGSTEALRKLAIQQNIANEITKKANAQVAEQTSVMAGWVAVINSSASSADTKRAALQKLIEINPDFRAAMSGEIADAEKLNSIYKELVTSIRAKAEAEVAASLSAEKKKDVLSITSIRQQLETEFARGSGPIRTIKGFTSEEVDKLLNGIDLSQTSIRATGNGGIQFNQLDIEKIKGNLKRQEDAAIGIFNDYVTAQAKTQSALLDLEDKAKDQAQKNAAIVAKGFEVDIEFLKTQITALDEQINKFKGTQQGLAKLTADRKKLQDQLDAALGNKKSTGRAAPSKLTGEQKDAFKDIDAIRDTELTDAKRLFSEKYIDEETYLNDVLNVNIKAIDAKLKIIKGANGEERKQIAQLHLDRITQEQETSNRVFELRKTDLKIQLDDEVKTIQERNRLIQQDPTASASGKAQAQLDADKAILDLQVAFGKDIDLLEKQLGQQSLKNAKESADAIRKTKQDILNDERELTQAALKDVQDTGQKLVAEFKAVISQARLNIANDPNLTVSKREKANAVLDREENIGTLARELASMQEQLPLYKQLLKEKQVTDTQYSEFIAALNSKQAQVLDALGDTTLKNVQKITSLGDLVKSKLKDLFNFETGSENDKLLGDVLTQSYSLAQDAMTSYFDAERQRINDSLQLQLERMDIEKQQLQARAQSKAEEDSLEKQYAAKKRAAERAAGEELKKTKRAEAKIALATELANIAVSAASNPANGVTFGAAGIIMYSLLAGLALGRYALNIASINREKFSYGGVPGRGGKFGGSSHSQGGTPFTFRGNNYEAEVDELSIIRTRNAPRNKVFKAVGTQMQIASMMNKAGGGIEFAPGGKLRTFDYGGNLGSNLQAPVFVPSYTNTIVAGGGSSNELLEEIKGIRHSINDHAVETSKRIDRLEVVQVTSSVTSAQKKQAKQSEIGTL